ncbi:MAG TPA: formylmethanofuran dehydrogenase subunit A [Acetobacteraceae bacterium]|nr:formylmethanofuran dehydrogenase subunit A [Acetobacteraceae bacterium]
MLTRLAGGHVIDPAHGTDAVGDLWFEDGHIIADPGADPGAGIGSDRTPDVTFDATGCVVMAGGVDIHSHIAGANVNTSRLLLPDQRGADGGFDSAPDAAAIGRLYAQMGFTTVVEPAIPPHVALQAQRELAAIPYIDKAILAVLGNGDYELGLLRDGEGTAALANFAGRMLAGARALGVKVINPGGAAAFRENVRSFGLDDEVPSYGVSSRAIFTAMQQAVVALGVPHPVHLHCNNLGMPGNVETALATIEAAGDLRLHLAHLQFYAYGKEGPRGFSSAALRLVEALATRPNVTADVGQVMFGQTVTVSCDTLRQFNARGQAHPRKSVIMDGEGNGGGIVPYRYSRRSFFNAVQWAAGLELFLLAPDPWRMFFTTDHPNGAPFTAYPDLFALLMDRDLRAQWIETVPKEAMSVCTLPSIAREYTLVEIATMTRAAAARLLGLADRGHLGPAARADIAVYRPQADRAAMFRHASMVFKDGRLIVRDGIALPEARAARGRALAVQAPYDAAIDRHLGDWYERVYGVSHAAFDVPDFAVGLADPFEAVPCQP